MATRKITIGASQALSFQKYRANFIHAYKLATAEDKKGGIEWYRQARTYASAIAKMYNVSLETVVAIIAALSPFTQWEHNLLSAWRLVHSVKVDGDHSVIDNMTGFRKNREKALAILLQDDPGLLSGPKVTSFADNILNPDGLSITIDFHMVRAAFRTSWTISWPGLSGKRYAEIKRALESAARWFDIHPAEFQAIVWNVARRKALPRTKIAGAQIRYH